MNTAVSLTAGCRKETPEAEPCDPPSGAGGSTRADMEPGPWKVQFEGYAMQHHIDGVRESCAILVLLRKKIGIDNHPGIRTIFQNHGHVYLRVVQRTSVTSVTGSRCIAREACLLDFNVNNK